ncbi:MULTISPECIES: hypothetical protein [Bradyrhizobium]|uniref:hypothetical protein n=1 Tax=Bradyrhizobium TaxID=374 RepID=UPI001ED9F71D|nr:hypothetical protein [Bradyrhizobium zhengyangense]MCG2639753.1 hypothetical protein [Bradyrhizobium zhengyangense]
MPAAYFVGRAIITDAEKRAAFDRWYETGVGAGTGVRRMAMATTVSGPLQRI